MVRRGFNHVMSSAVCFDDHSISSAFRDQFIRLVRLESGELAGANGGSGNSDTTVLFPGCVDHFEKSWCFSGNDKRIGFTLLREKDLRCGGCDYALTALCQLAGEGIHGSCFAACSNYLNEMMSWLFDKVRL